jgi:hypothetical protein
MEALMSQSETFIQKLFRRNSFVLLMALVAISLCVSCDQKSKSQPGAPKDPSVISAEEGEPPLTLANAEIVSGDGLIKMRLVREEEAKFSSSGGGYGEIHNILFIPSGEGSPHWLLQDNKHHFAHEREIREPSRKSEENGREIATAAILLGKDARYNSPGSLILFDPTGEHVLVVAQDVLSIELASRTKDDITLFYRRGPHFVRATFDPVTLAKRTEREIEIPQLK